MVMTWDVFLLLVQLVIVEISRMYSVGIHVFSIMTLLIKFMETLMLFISIALRIRVHFFLDLLISLISTVDC
jgi:hypothetical protein